MVWLAPTESRVDVPSLEALLGGKPLLQAVIQLSFIPGFHFRVHVCGGEERERVCASMCTQRRWDWKLCGPNQTAKDVANAGFLCGQEEET